MEVQRFSICNSRHQEQGEDKVRNKLKLDDLNENQDAEWWKTIILKALPPILNSTTSVYKKKDAIPWKKKEV